MVNGKRRLLLNIEDRFQLIRLLVIIIQYKKQILLQDNHTKISVKKLFLKNKMSNTLRELVLASSRNESYFKFWREQILANQRKIIKNILQTLFLAPIKAKINGN